MKNRAINSIRILSPFCATAAMALTFLSGPIFIDTAKAQQSLPEQEAHAIGVDAYIYFYPLVTMDITRKQFTNIDKGFGRGPMNAFSNVPIYPPASDKTVVRTNYDTLYLLAYLDLLKEPVIVSVPDTDGRFYLLPMLDMWTDVFASLGWRTTGTQAGNFLVTPPGWNGTVADDLTRINAPTPYVWIIGRTKTDGPPDYEVVHRFRQATRSLYSLSGARLPNRPNSKSIPPSI